MRAFFEPNAVAVVGASRRPRQIGAEILRNLRATGFRGPIHPVHPSAAVVDGLPAHARVTDIPGDVDLAIIAVPAAQVEGVVDDCVRKGVRALVIISAGFAEVGAEGRAREARIVEKVRASGARLVGPNCMGLLNTDPAVRLNATFSPVYPPEGRVAMSTQSGALGLAILDYARKLNLGISTFVSVGNKPDVSGNDLIQYWEQDARTSVILLYLESFGNPRKFSRLARRVARKKPIVAVKAGRSGAGARAAASHTGALASSDAVVEGLFRQAGIIRTNTLEEMFDVAALVAHQPVPAGRRVAILTNAGGPGILAADACEAEGLTLPPPGAATLAELRSFLPAAAGLGNPIDMIASASAEHYGRAMRALLGDDAFDALLVIFIPPLVTDAHDVARAVVDAARGAGDKTVLACFMAAQGAPPELLPIPCYVFPEAAATALARAAAYGGWLRRPPGEERRLGEAEGRAARAVVDRVLARGGGWLRADEVEALLSAAGIRCARARLAKSHAAAVAAATEIGFPVALKTVGESIVHKTEVGGVRLGVPDAATVEATWDDWVERLGTRLDGVSVQEMVSGGVEVIVGSLDDARFGHLLVYGSGGTMVELHADVAFRLHPVTDADLDDMLADVKGSALLRGWRGAPPADERALRDLILAVSALVDRCPEILEMDVNPVKVLTSRAVVLDARVRVGAPPVAQLLRHAALAAQPLR
jgi:acetyl coenzyme A synthetase (ADP forming)-like protein